MRVLLPFILSIIITGSGVAQKTIKYDKGTYNIGICSKQDEISILSKDLILLNIKYSYLTRIKEADIPLIHSNYGPGYNEKICVPVIRSSVRKSIGTYTIEEIFSTRRDEIENELLETSKKKLHISNINLEGLYITDIDLPPRIRASMEEKMVTEQEILVQENKIKISKMESERKRIEAESVATYNRILDSTLTEKVLQMKYIEALAGLAKSQNTKIIVVDSDKPELPIIIDKNQKE
ncbi:MAG: prohibitin family protein [Bacteroidales bacterium]|nr:MAG: prohibitin family protein [Bacteroidales bacterium]